MKIYYGKGEDKTTNQSEANDKENDYVDPAGFEQCFDYAEGKNGKPRDYHKAYEIALEYAQKGFSRAYLFLGGFCYRRGNGTEINIKEAIFWLEKASSDYALACLELGYIYYYDFEPNPDYSRALSYFKAGAALNDADSMNMVGIF